MKKNYFKIMYEPEDDILNIWLSKKLYDHGEYNDGVVVHYTKDGEPVYIEILFASRFFKEKGLNKKAKSLVKEKYLSVAVPHRIK